MNFTAYLHLNLWVYFTSLHITGFHHEPVTSRHLHVGLTKPIPSPVGWLCVILPTSVLTSTRLFNLSGCQYLMPMHMALAAAPNPDPGHGYIRTHSFTKHSNDKAAGNCPIVFSRSPPAFFVEGCMPGKQEVVRFEVGTALHCGRVGGSALKGHHGIDVETHQLPVQVLQTPVIYHTHTHTQHRESHS